MPQTPHIPPRNAPTPATLAEFDYPKYAQITLPLFQEELSQCEASIHRDKFLITGTNDYTIVGGGPIGRLMLDPAELAAIAGAAVFIPALRDALLAKWGPIAPP
jgi:hypothetical protein